MHLSTLQHSVFLQSLGWAIINSLWQAAILWILAQVILLSYKGASARFRSNVSACILLSIFVWFTYTFLYKFYALSIIGIGSPAYEAPLAGNGSYAWVKSIEKAITALPFLSLAYLLLLPVLAIRLVLAYKNLLFIRHNGLQKPPAAWKIFMQTAALEIGIHKKIAIWLSEHVDVPATIGFLKPIILLPLATVNNLSIEQLEAIILHELSHIKRNDYLLNMLIVGIETILFFNPFVVLITRTIKKERENCCDDLVLQYQYDRHAYASALLSLEVKRQRNLRLSLAATSGKRQLMGRIERIMEGKAHGDLNYGQKILALLCITGIMCSIQWISIPGRPAEKKQVARVQSKTGVNNNIVPADKKVVLQPVKQRTPIPRKIITKIITAVDNGFNQEEEIALPDVQGKLLSQKDGGKIPQRNLWPETFKLMFDSLQQTYSGKGQIISQFRKLQNFKEQTEIFKAGTMRRFKFPSSASLAQHMQKIVKDSLVFIRQHGADRTYKHSQDNQFVFNFDGMPHIDSTILNAFRSVHTQKSIRSMIKIATQGPALKMLLEKIKLDIRDGIVYINGNALVPGNKELTGSKNDKRLFLFDNGSKHLEIDMNTLD